MKDIGEYERTRQLNIARNEAFLKDIGLHQVKKDIASSSCSERQLAGTKRKQRSVSHEIEKTRRRSSRLQKISTDDKLEQDSDNVHQGAISTDRQQLKKSYYKEASFGDDSDKRKRITPQILLDYILARSEEHYNSSTSSLVVHTVDRINSMSIQQLQNRMTKITTAQKMILFYYGLSCADLDDLAESAKEKLKTMFKIYV